MNEKETTVLPVGYNGANNTGAEALLLSDIEDVRKVLGPNARISVPTLAPENLRRYVQETPTLTIAPIPILYFRALRRLVKEHDVVMLVEGSTYMDTWGSVLLWAFLWSTWCAARLGKRILAYAVDAGKLSRFNRWLVRRIASRTNLIVTRNRAAAERLAAYGVSAPIEATADNAFTSRTRPEDKGWPQREWPRARDGMVGMAVVDYHLFPVVMRPWGRKEDCYKWPYFFSRSAQLRRASEELAAGYARIADLIVEKHGAPVALICMEEVDERLALEVHAAVRFLVDHRPASLVIFIATRADPPFPLARLRSQDRVAEIRAEDLRFTAAEAGQFFDRAMSLSLSAAQVAVLERRTEGWVAGLQMAALSLQGREDVDGFIASFSGTHRYILEYLVEEVLSRQDDELKKLLLDTSILTRMSAGLCEAVTGRCGCQETLKQLERMNLFLVPLDEQRNWFRYHHLFADLLRHKLELERLPEEIHALHMRAGDWFAGQGELVEAIQEYLAAKAHEKVADLIEARFYDIISNGALSQLQRWCREIPSEVMEKRHGYCVAAAWTLAWAGRRQEAEALLDRVERSISGGNSGTMRAPAEKDSGSIRILEGSVAAIRAVLSDMAGETTRAVELARKAERLLPPKDDMPGTVILYILATSYLNQGELERAEEGCGELLRASHAAGSIWSICAAVCELVRLRSLQGRLRDSQALLEEFDALAVRRHARGSGPIAKAYVLMAELKRERGELDEALRIAEKAVKDVDAWGLPSDVYMTHQFLARVLRSRGQAEQAQEELAKVQGLPRRALVWARLLPSFEADRVKTYLARGDIASAEAWIREYNPGKAETPVNREVVLVSLARIRLAAGVTDAGSGDISSLLDDLACSARSGGRIGPLIAILLLQARAKASLSAQGDALNALNEAVRLAQPGGYLRIFVEEGPQIFELLRRGQESGMWSSPPVKNTSVAFFQRSPVPLNDLTVSLKMMICASS
jgi:LuxR family maltose regulon positive regulatory protein